MKLPDFFNLKKGIDEFTSSLRDVSKRIESLKREREDIACAPPAREDIKTYFRAIIASRGQNYADAIARHVSPLRAKELQQVQDPQHMQHAAVLALTPAGSLAATAKTLDSALCLLMGDEIKRAIERVVDEMPWPANAMPISERARRLASIDAELDELLARERELVATARSAGLVVEPGAWDGEKLHGR